MQSRRNDDRRALFELDGGARSCRALDLTVIGTGTLGEIEVIGSGAGERVDWAHVVLTNASEHFGSHAWLGGFVARPERMTGAIRVDVAGQAAPTMTGAFGRLLERTAGFADAWPVAVKASYPDGTTEVAQRVLDRDRRSQVATPTANGADAISSDVAQTSAASFGVEHAIIVGRAKHLEPSKIRLGTRVGLDVPAGAVKQPTNITVRHLGDDDLPPLDPGMINVTAPRGRGYEFLPHGIRFQRAVEVIVPYDASALPEGMTPEDVHTYFFDTTASRWRRLDRVAIDVGESVARSKTDHFTIMIDAVLTTPKNPAPLAFDPTMLTSIAAASPAANVDLIAPPQANPSGDARLSLPIRVPSGRGKYSPALSVDYDSSGGNAWLGVGWSVHTSAIEIDTRWGVPTYAPGEEVRYLLDGAELVPTLETDGPKCQDGSTGRRYHTRIEGGFAHIQRCWLSWGAYQFEVRDRDGTLFVYGVGSPGDQSAASLANVYDGSQIVRWNLARVVDLRGNTTRYLYERDDIINTPEPSRDVYLRKILYTSHAELPTAPFEINLELDDGTRPDRIVDGRAGFKRVTRHLLRAIHVKYNDQTFRSYVLTYAHGQFDRSVLSSVRQYGIPGCIAGTNAFELPTCGDDFRAHTFDVYAENTQFAPPVAWNVTGDPRPRAAALGRGETKTTSGGLFVTGGDLSGTGPSGTASIGASAGERGERVGTYDLDGDGKPDQIIHIPALRFLGLDLVPDAGMYVLYNQSRPGLDPTVDPLLARDDERTATNFPGMGIERFRAISVDARVSGTISGIGGSLGAGFGNSTARARRVVADANGDGFMDVIDGAGFALLGAPCATGMCFTQRPFPVAASVDPKEDSWLIQMQDDEAERTMVVDPVVRWTAPFDGRIRASVNAHKPVAGGTDGVSIELFDEETLVTGITLGPDATDPVTFAAPDEIDVVAGQAIYLRVRTGNDVGLDPDGKLADKVDAHLSVQYVRACPDSICADVTDPFSAREPSGAGVFAYDSQSDFRLAGQPAVLPIFAGGTLRFHARLTKRASLADIRVCVQRFISTPEITPRLDAPCDATADDVENLAPTMTLPADSSTPTDIDLTFAVTAGQLIIVRAEADLSFDPTDVAIEAVDPLSPMVGYTEACLPNDAATGFQCFTDPEVVGDVPLMTQFFGVFVPVSSEVAVLPFVAPTSDSLDLDAFLGPSEPFVFAVRSDRQGILWLSDCKAQSCGPIDVPALALTAGESVTLELVVDGAGLSSQLSGTFAGLSTTVPLATRDLVPEPPQRTPFAGGFRGFSATAWNDDEPFQPQRLLADLEVFPILEEERQQEIQRTVIAPLPKFAVTPNTEGPRWIAPGTATFVSATTLHAGPVSGEIDADTDTDLEDAIAGLFARHYVRLSGTRSGYLSGSFGLKKYLDLSLGVTVSSNVTRSTTDLVDLTGDGVPEVIASTGVKLGSWTLVAAEPGPTGHVLDGAFRIRRGTEFAVNFNGGCTPTTTASGRTTGVTCKDGVDRGSIGFSGGAGLAIGRSQTTKDLVDLNGDGLPDLVRRDGTSIYVSYNLGHRFGAEESFGTVASALQAPIDHFESDRESTATEIELDSTSSALQHDTTISRHVEGGFSVAVISVSSGSHQSSTRTTRQLADINGDGRPDLLVKRDDENFIVVQINRGADFAPATVWPLGQWSDGQSWPLEIPEIQDGRLSSFDVTGPDVLASTTSTGRTSGGSVMIPITGYIGVGGSLSNSKDTDSYDLSLLDIDGDAIPDHVLRQTPACPPPPCIWCPPPPCNPESHVYVKKSEVSGKGNLLRVVHNPLGGSITLEYQRTDSSVEMPSSRLVLSHVEVDDGVDLGPAYASPTIVTDIAYEDGFFHRGEKEFFGFAKVTATRADGVKVEQVFDNASYALHGQLVRETQRDAAGGLLGEHSITHDVLAVRGEDDLALRSDPACVANLHVLLTPEACQPVHPVVSRDDSTHVEGGTLAKTHTTRDVSRDRFGDVLASIDEGDDAITGDELHVQATYEHDLTTWILGRIASLEVRAGSASGTLLRRRTGTYSSFGDLASVSIVTGTAAGTATSTLTYDVFGNLKRLTSPPNEANQSQTYDVEYDAATATYPTKMTDGFGLSSSALYDVRFGVATSETDANHVSITRTFDAFGRLMTVRGPYDPPTGSPAIEMTYQLGGVPRAVTRTRTSAPPGYAGSVAPPITVVTFVDGTARSIEVRKTSVVAGQLGMTTSGLVQLDYIGHQILAYQPFFTQGADDATNFALPTATPHATRTDYDSHDRPIAITYPNGDVDRTSYAIEAAPISSSPALLATTSVAANGNRRESYTDLAGRLRAFVEHPSATSAAVSRYDYLATGELAAIVDAEGNVTTLGYDLRGLRTSFNNPDTGLIEDRFDAMGNRVALVEPNHRAVNAAVHFEFDRDRLSRIDYPSKPDVTMTYGASTATDLSAGRLIRVDDESGNQRHEYGRQGEIVRTVRTVAPAEQGSQSLVFDTHFVTDSLGRQLSIQYPDGVTVASSYDGAGMLARVDGAGTGWTRVYASEIQYDVYGNRTRLRAGNGVMTTWQFEPERVRLRAIDTTLPANQGSRPVQALRFSYDPSSNPIRIENALPTLVGGSGNLPGNSTATYQYDGVDRLIRADGTAQLSSQKTTTYSQTHGYSTSHNLLAKARTHNILQPLQGTSQPTATNFASDYVYESGRPHLPSRIGDLLLTYDPSGNPLTRTPPSTGASQALVWDDDGRMVDFQGGGIHQHNTFDAGGLRVRRKSTQSETVFASMYFDLENGTQGVRHVFAGDLRVASELGKFASGENPMPPDKRGTGYFFHGDHLTTTTVLTADDGSVHQSLEYFPDGEAWIDRGPVKPVNRYLFSGKAFDPDTGFYDFGHRFYEPRVGLWLGVDPGVVDAPSTLVSRPSKNALASFSAANPVAFTDPDGEDEFRFVSTGSTRVVRTADVRGYADAVYEVDVERGTTTLLYYRSEPPLVDANWIVDTIGGGWGGALRHGARGAATWGIAYGFANSSNEGQAGCATIGWALSFATSGRTGQDIALGTKQHSGRTFAERVGAAYHEDWAALGLYDATAARGWPQAFHSALERTLAAGGKIKFDLTGLNVAEALAGDINEWVGRYTAWELQQVVNNVRYRMSTTFYLNGKPLSPQELGKLGL